MIENTDGQISDIASRVSVLEQVQPEPKAETVQSYEKHYFNPSLPLVYANPSAVTDWADSGSGKYIPSSAKEAIIMAWVEDTNGGTGRTLLQARGGGIERNIASLFESVDTADSAGGGYIFIPLSEGSFDWRLSTLASGASGANVRIELIGYVK